MKKLWLCLLSLCLLLTGVSCARGEDTAEVTSSPTEIVSHGLVAVGEMSEYAELSDWYADSSAREVVRNAILYSRDEGDGLWHCWLYLGAWTEGDTLAFGAVVAEGYCVVIDHTAQNADGGGGGVFYFTVDTDAEPRFELRLNGEDEGMIETHAATSLKRA